MVPDRIHPGYWVTLVLAVVLIIAAEIVWTHIGQQPVVTGPARPPVTAPAPAQQAVGGYVPRPAGAP